MEWTTSVVWVMFTLCSLATTFIPFLKKIASHGKCNKREADGPDSTDVTLANYIHEKMFIPKKMFAHLYVIGASCALWNVISEIAQQNFTANAGVLECITHILHSRLLLVLLLWTLHVLRRLFESLLITRYGDSRMHVAGFVAGLVHYVAVPLCFREGNDAGSESDSDRDIFCLSFQDIILMGVPCLIFLFANYIQSETHFILFRMKAEQLATSCSEYKLPTRSWFKLMCVPHYTAEVIIYLSLALLMPCRHWSSKLLVVWVTSNLSVVASRQYVWYQQQFPDEIPTPWYRLLPYVW